LELIKNLSNIDAPGAAHHICARGSVATAPPHLKYNDFNKRNLSKTDGVVNDEILDNLDKIKVYTIEIKSEQDFAREIARIASLSMALGYKLEDEGRLLTKDDKSDEIVVSQKFKFIEDTFRIPPSGRSCQTRTEGGKPPLLKIIRGSIPHVFR
jgi:hypothetical protein